MSNDMKCPVCKGELHIFKSSTQDAIVCADCGFDGNTKLWQELIRTRTALEIIKKEMSKETMPDFAVISDALKTALEQKDE